MDDEIMRKKFSYERLKIRRDGDFIIVPGTIDNNVVDTKVALDDNGINFLIDIANGYLKRIHYNE